MKFEQSVRELARAIPEDRQDSEFIDSLYQIRLDLIERNGISFPKDRLKNLNQHACEVNRLKSSCGMKKDDTQAHEE